MTAVREKTYVDLGGERHCLAELDRDERDLVEQCIQFANEHPEWPEYANWWMPQVGAFYNAKGLSRRETTKTIGWKIAQDLDGRIMIAAGLARAPDYRDEIEQLIEDRFSTRRSFCEATGLSEDMLSHVLAKRKHLAIDTLADALARIGYALHIAPLPDVK